MSSTLEENDIALAGVKAGDENGNELVIDVEGIVETPASLDESTTAMTTTASEAADFTTELPFDSSANTDAGIEPRANDTTTDAATEQAEPGNDVAEAGGKGGQDSEEWSEDDIVTTVPVSSFYEGTVITEEDGEVLRDRIDVRSYREYERRRNSAQSRVADAYLDMVSAKVAAKAAADHLTSEGEALEKIVAGGWRAIKREMEAAGRAAIAYRDATDDATKNPVSAASVVESTACDSIYGDSSTLDAQAPSEAVSDAWRDCTIAELGAHGLRSSLVNRLAELGYDTIGKLEDLRAKISTGAVDRWPKGIGEAKITEIENAVVDWLTANRDAGVFGAIPTSVGDEVEAGDAEEAAEGGQDSAEDSSEYPSTEAWDKMTAEKKKGWLVKRSEKIMMKPGEMKPVESERAFNAGRDAWHAGKNVYACDYYPGARGDDWLRGWVTGSMEPQRVKAAAVKKEAAETKAETTEAAPSTSVDDLFG